MLRGDGNMRYLKTRGYNGMSSFTGEGEGEGRVKPRDYSRGNSS